MGLVDFRKSVFGKDLREAIQMDLGDIRRSAFGNRLGGHPDGVWWDPPNRVWEQAGRHPDGLFQVPSNRVWRTQRPFQTHFFKFRQSVSGNDNVLSRDTFVDSAKVSLKNTTCFPDVLLQISHNHLRKNEKVSGKSVTILPMHAYVVSQRVQKRFWKQWVVFFSNALAHIFSQLDMENITTLLSICSCRTCAWAYAKRTFRCLHCQWMEWLWLMDYVFFEIELSLWFGLQLAFGGMSAVCGFAFVMVRLLRGWFCCVFVCFLPWVVASVFQGLASFSLANAKENH